MRVLFRSGPRQQGDAALGQPLLRGSVGGRHAAGPGHVQRIGEAEVVGQDAEAGAAVAAGVLIGFVNPRGSPVRTAEGADEIGRASWREREEGAGGAGEVEKKEDSSEKKRMRRRDGRES